MPRITSDPADRSGSAADLRDVLERLDLGVVVRRMEIGFAQLPAYTRFRWPVDRAAVVRWNVDLTLRWLINGTPPDDYVRAELHEFLRARAAAGQPIEDSILVYRRGARLFWEAVLDLADDATRAVLLAGSDTVWQCLEDYLDLIVRMLAEAYGDQFDSPATAGDRRARALFDRLCVQLPITVEDRDRAARLGFDLVQDHCPFVAQLRGGQVASHAALAGRLREAGALAFTEGVQVAGLVPAGFDWREFLADASLLFGEAPPTPRPRLAAVTDSLRALIAVAAAAGRRGRARVDDFLPELLLAESPEMATRIAGRVFEPLKRADAADLADTLRCLAAHDFNTAAAAAALPVHRNTLLYRVGRIEKLTGLNLAEQRDRTLVLLAVTWQGVAGSVGPTVGG
ncbi:PucR family transcriptional regulator [Actinospica acidithermotolerans]|nr:helix-turn-helix domain-containing protein [Actinospica acidithermotolerans]